MACYLLLQLISFLILLLLLIIGVSLISHLLIHYLFLYELTFLELIKSTSPRVLGSFVIDKRCIVLTILKAILFSRMITFVLLPIFGLILEFHKFLHLFPEIVEVCWSESSWKHTKEKEEIHALGIAVLDELNGDLGRKTK